MEIGTGSGYSSAVLSRLVGRDGRVVSIDVDAALVKRAGALHKQAGHRNVEVYAADGFAGWELNAPFDRIVAWTTPHVLPEAWVAQTAPGGVIVTPVKVADIACANALIRCTIGEGIENGAVYPGSFIEMAPDVITELALPVRYVNASLTSATEPPWWISARLLHGENPEIAHALLDQAREAEPQPDFFLGGHDVREAFNAFVLARSNHPASLGGSPGWGIGTGVKGSIAVVLPNGALLATGTQQAHDELAVLRDEWISLGKPHHESLAPTFVQTGDGWLVHLELRKLG